jgi:hypothetical protein
MMLVRAALSVPVQSASVERGFSIHRVIKHRLSSKIGVQVFDSLMRLRMAGAEYMPLVQAVVVPLMLENRQARSQLIDDAVSVMKETGTMREEKLPFYMSKLGAIQNQVIEISLQHGLQGVDEFVVGLERDFAPEDEDEEVALTDKLPEPEAPPATEDDKLRDRKEGGVILPTRLCEALRG